MLRIRHEGLPVSMVLASTNQSQNRLAESLVYNDVHMPELPLANRQFDDDKLRDRFPGHSTS